MRVRRLTEDELTLRDATGRPYPPRPLAHKLLDTVVRSVGVAFLLVAIGLVWQAVN